MTTNEIIRSDFNTDLRGYARKEVENHLVIVSQLVDDKEQQIATLTGEIEHANRTLQELNEQLQQAAHDREYLDSALVKAQNERDTAEQALAKAQAQSTHSTVEGEGERHELGLEEIAAVASLTTKLEESESALQRAHDRIAQLETQSDDQVVTEALERAKRAEAVAKEAMESEQLLKRTLIMAQRTADITIAEARSQAATVRKEADSYAQRVTSEADKQATDVRTQADRYAQTTRSSADFEASETTQQASDAASKMTQDAAERAEEAITEAREEAARRIKEASDDAHEMRDSSQRLLAEAVRQAKSVAELRRTYAARARAAIEDHVVAFSNIATLPDLPDDLQEFLDNQY